MPIRCRPAPPLPAWRPPRLVPPGARSDGWRIERHRAALSHLRLERCESALLFADRRSQPRQLRLGQVELGPRGEQARRQLAIARLRAPQVLALRRLDLIAPLQRERVPGQPGTRLSGRRPRPVEAETLRSSASARAAMSGPELTSGASDRSTDSATAPARSLAHADARETASPTRARATRRRASAASPRAPTSPRRRRASSGRARRAHTERRRPPRASPARTRLSHGLLSDRFCAQGLHVQIRGDESHLGFTELLRWLRMELSHRAPSERA